MEENKVKLKNCCSLCSHEKWIRKIGIEKIWKTEAILIFIKMEIYRSKKKKESQPIVWADEFEKWKYFHLYFRYDLRWHSFFLLKIRNSTKTNKAEQRRKKILIFRIYSRKWQSNGYIWKPIIDFAIKYVRHFKFVIFPRMTKVTKYCLEKRENIFFLFTRPQMESDKLLLLPFTIQTTAILGNFILRIDFTGKMKCTL